MTETSPPAARFAPNGDRYTAALFIDANSLYLWSTEQPQPLTPGLRWIQSNKTYRKQYLSTGGSFEALQYLYYSQALLDAQGLNVNIEHQYFQGEKYVYGYKCDGYVNINGKEIVYEFHGKDINIMEKYLYSRRLLFSWMQMPKETNKTTDKSSRKMGEEKTSSLITWS